MQMLDRHHPLPGGDRIRLRLPHVDRSCAGARVPDAPGPRPPTTSTSAAACAGRPGAAGPSIATRWDGACEQIVGIAAVDAADGAPTLLAEDPAVCDLLARALAEHAGSGAPRRCVA